MEICHLAHARGVSARGYVAGKGRRGAGKLRRQEWCTAMTADYAIVLAGHGSRDPDGVREFEQLVALMRERVGRHRLDYGYLEFARAALAEAVQVSIATGSRRIVVVPALLFAATHAKNDMPGELH